MRLRRVLVVLFLAISLGTMLLAACGASDSAPSQSPAPATAGSAAAPTAGSAEGLLQQRCQACHSLNRVQSAHKTQAAWEKTVRRMVGQGAQLSDTEFAALVAYLAATYK